MPWSSSSVPDSMKNKSLSLRQLFARVANAALDKGMTEEEAIFAGLSAVSNEERKNRKEVKKEVIEPPSHIKAIIEARKASKQPVDEEKEKPLIRQAFLGKNALTPDQERSLVSATWDAQGRLVLTFDTGERITTDPVPSEYIEQHLSVAVGSQIPDQYDHLQFNTATDSLNAVGRLRWNDVDGTLDLGLKGGNVTLQIGQEQVVHIYNNTAGNFSDLQVVRVTGSQGQRLTASLAQANNETNSAKSFAVVTEPILKNQVGFATVLGLVREVNTAAFPEGSALYLSPTVAGGMTATRPVAPNHAVFIGWCVRSHAVQGSIFVNIQNGSELEELHNVLITSVQHGQVLKYDAVSGIWKNQDDNSSADAPETDPVFTYNLLEELTRIDYSSGNYKLFIYNVDGDLIQQDYVKGLLTYRKVFNYTNGLLTSIDDSVI